MYIYKEGRKIKSCIYCLYVKTFVNNNSAREGISFINPKSTIPSYTRQFKSPET